MINLIKTQVKHLLWLTDESINHWESYTRLNILIEVWLCFSAGLISFLFWIVFKVFCFSVFIKYNVASDLYSKRGTFIAHLWTIHVSCSHFSNRRRLCKSCLCLVKNSVSLWWGISRWKQNSVKWCNESELNFLPHAVLTSFTLLKLFLKG